MTSIGFYGMTHLGLVSAVAAADKGCTVIAYDPNPTLIAQLQQHEYPIEEPQFRELMSAHANLMCFTAEIDQLLEAELIYIAIDVPTNTENHSDVQPIRNALEHLKKGLHAGQTVVVLSQVPPGFMRSLTLPSEQLFYQVETLIFGHAIERATQPERFIIGCTDPSKNLPPSYDAFLQKFNCPLLKMRYESAELAKIAINMYLVSSVMTSNLLADLASSVGADWQEVVPTLRLDKRIGQYAYLDPGLGISGGNLERDMMTINQLAQKYRVRAELVNTWLSDSNYYKNWVYRCIQREVFPKTDTPVIAILGLAYKANTHSVKNSPSLALIDVLQKTAPQLRIQVHDPVVTNRHCEAEGRSNPELNPGLLRRLQRLAMTADALRSADALVIMTPWPEYTKLSVNDLSTHMRGRIIIDPYRILNHSEFVPAGFHIYTLGVNTHTPQKHTEVSYA